MFSCIQNILLASPVVVDKSKNIHDGFKLPISYVDPKFVHSLSPQVSADLELASDISGNGTVMYDHILQPENTFAKGMIVEWNKQFTTHVPFLIDSQSVLKSMPDYIQKVGSSTADCDKVMGIWKDTKEDVHFLEKYNYIEWDILKHLNNSNTFLQTVSIINMSSPVLSLIIPIIFFIFPFVLLKIQGVPITFSTYIVVLKDVAKNHFIGSMINNIQSISWDKLMYILVTAGLYMLQIYQNYTACVRFYSNVNRINTRLCDMQAYLDHSIKSMDAFVDTNHHLPTYSTFCNTTRQRCDTLKQFRDELASIQPFTAGFSKIAEIGHMLKCFYKLHSDADYEDSLRYSIGFEGFVNNLIGIHRNLSDGIISYAEFSMDDSRCDFHQQFYPAYAKSDHVKNNCSLDRNIILTGPNASGKTTILKTTALNIIFTQQFGVGFYKSCVLTPYSFIHSYLNIPDTSGRDSLFQAESRRCKDIIDIIDNPTNVGARHFCIFDELYSGTNPSEAIISAYAFLTYLSNKPAVEFMLTTHYVAICKKLKKSKRIANYKMSVKLTDSNIQYTYKMREGVSKVRGGVLILEEMNYPKEILDMIRK
jgi:hypothetical protein